MEWLSDFGHWLLISQGGLIVGSVLIWAGLVTAGGYLVWRWGDVRMGPDPAPPPVQEPRRRTTYVWETTTTRTQEVWFPLAEEFAADVQDVTAAVIDLTDTVEILEVVDPLADTVELEVADETTPLFYQIRRPKPYVAESFTQGIQRAQIERAKAAKELAP